MSDERLAFRIPEVARLTGLSRARVYQAAARKEIPTIRIGRAILVPREALERLLNDAEKQE